MCSKLSTERLLEEVMAKLRQTDELEGIRRRLQGEKGDVLLQQGLP